MKINAERVKQLRAEKNWSQEKLSEASGIGLRTIQRLESSGKASRETVRLLTAVFNLEPTALAIEEEPPTTQTPIDVIKNGFINFDDFSGTATRYEYWWFFLFTLLILAVGVLIHEHVAQILAIILMIPLAAVGTRRLNDIGRSGWWQLFAFVPFGIIVVLILMGQEGDISSTQKPAPNF